MEPPGEARSDLDILIDFAHRLGLQDKDGQPLVKWTDAEGAFEGWKECSRGRPCDYTGMSYDKLRGGSGIQWPCNDEHPDGTERIYVDGQFWAHPEYCESYGRDLVTGAPVEETEYKALNPTGRAVLKAAEYVPPHELPSQEYPFQLITGRTLYHFHTRTKTGRAPQLHAAAPEVWVEMSAGDAADRRFAEGDLLEISTPRGRVRARLRISGIRPGVLFLPFHYGYWDTEDGAAPRRKHDGRAANELTLTDWDPVSKQPIFKTAAAQVECVGKGRGTPAPAPTTTGSAPVTGSVPPTEGGDAARAEELLGGHA
ncbi:molybdopterin oxidoreductase family protein [Geodermatophilus sp. SYSU D01176]